MNLRKGFRRLTLVISLILFLFCVMWGFLVIEPDKDGFDNEYFFYGIHIYIWPFISFVSVWVVYFVISWVVKGFKGK